MNYYTLLYPFGGLVGSQLSYRAGFAEYLPQKYYPVDLSAPSSQTDHTGDAGYLPREYYPVGLVLLQRVIASRSHGSQISFQVPSTCNFSICTRKERLVI